METIDLLQEVVSDYDGTVLIVSHDRDFLDRTVTGLLAFEEDGRVIAYACGYSDYLERRRKQLDKQQRPQQASKNSQKIHHETNGQTGRPRASKPGSAIKQAYLLEKLPDEIATICKPKLLRMRACLT